MRRKTAFGGLVLTLSTALVTRAIEPAPRYNSSPGWYGPASVVWGLFTDYEASSFSMGVNEYLVDIYSFYRTSSSQTWVTKHMWRSSNGNEYFSTIIAFENGQQTQSGDPFNFVPERRNYACVVYDAQGQRLAENTVNSYTLWWLKHDVTRWPNGWQHLSPSGGFAKIAWVYTTLGAECGQHTPVEDVTVTEKGYTKNGMVTGVQMPLNNIETSSLPTAGKDL